MIVAISYLVSAAVMGFMRWRGAEIGTWFLAGWLLTGLAGVLLAQQLAEARPAVWIGLLVALLPWMVLSLVFDTRLKIWVMVAVDAAGVFAIVYGLALARGALSQVSQ